MQTWNISERCKEIYELKKAQKLEDIGSEGYILKHRKSGARIAVISNDDNNKVFSIGFRTPPKDSTGVAHIIEHSVLCGSRDYPVKDPFVELVKGSLNTFLNAMTYSDKTVYPVASCNDKDFANIMNVYMDAVFYPKMYDRKEIFEQEGWHYEMDDVSSALTINGVVYNEMRGVFSSADQLLDRMIQKALFPDTTYGYESGGDPSDIPKLTYNDFLEFHKKYYHPSNSYIYLYGDIDIEERLLWMDKHYLRFFDEIQPDSAIGVQQPFNAQIQLDGKYSSQGDDDKAHFSYNCVVDTSLNNEFQMAFQVLSYALVLVPGAPLKQALTDAGIAEEINCYFDGELIQPVFSITAREADIERKEDFTRIIKETLTRLCRDGIDKRSLMAAISSYEFRYREADFGRFPKGLMYGLQSLQTWLYDDNTPFEPLLLNDIFDELKKKVETDYFEKLIEKYILNNTHSAVVCVFPEKGLSTKLDEKLAKELEAYKSSLSENDIVDIVENTRQLHKYQQTPDTVEALASIPLLKREDIDKQTPEIYLDKKEISSIPVLHHNLFTNGIAYICLAFDVTDMEEYLPYINILTLMLGSVDTVNYKYLELSNEINLNTGGMSVNASVGAHKGNTDDCNIKFEMSVRVLYSSMEKAFDLIKEIIKGSILNDKKRLREILQENRAGLKSSLEAAGHSTAVNRSMSYISKSSFLQNQLGGIESYRFVDELCTRFDELSDSLINILEALVYRIFRKDRLLVSITADDEGYRYFEDESFDIFDTMYDIAVGKLPPLLPVHKPIMKRLNEGFKTPGKVQYVARTGNFIKKGYEYSGCLRVVKTILSYNYLWNNVRIAGGAYGAMCGFARSGDSYFVSYRDPKLQETNNIFENIPEFLENFDVDEREMTKYIIGTMSEVDAVLTPRAKGTLAYTMYRSGLDQFDMQRERDSILTMTPEDVKKSAALVKAVLECDNICVVGSEAAIEVNKDMFLNIEKLS